MTAPVFHSRLTSGLLAVTLCGALSACGVAPMKTASVPKPETASAADPATLLVNADAAYAAQDWASAERDYLALSRVQPANSQPPFKLGNLYTRTGKLEQASAAYLEAVKRDPGFDRAWHNLGIVQLRQARASLGKAAESTGSTTPDVQNRATHLVEGIDALLAPQRSAK